MDSIDDAGVLKAGGGTASKARKRPAARARTLGEVLVDRLADEPDAVDEVWSELTQARCEVSSPMADAILRACATSRGGGLSAALEILRAGSSLGMLSQQSRASAVCTLFGLCQREDGDVEAVIDELTDADRELPEVRRRPDPAPSPRLCARVRRRRRRRRLRRLRRLHFSAAHIPLRAAGAPLWVGGVRRS